MDICKTKFLSSLFSLDKETKSFVAEISTLGGNAHDNVPFTRVYDDACDVGFVIISKKSRDEAVFAEAQTFCDEEGDVTHWEFYPTRDTVRRLPLLKDWKAVVFND